MSDHPVPPSGSFNWAAAFIGAAITAGIQILAAFVRWLLGRRVDLQDKRDKEITDAFTRLEEKTAENYTQLLERIHRLEVRVGDHHKPGD